MAGPTLSRRSPLQAARLRADLTQRQLAERAGLARSTLTSAEGGYLPHPRTRRRIAEALGVDERTLWPSEDPSPSPAKR